MGLCHMPSPCENCPFRREGGVRLRASRVIEIAGQAGSFTCHKTVNRKVRKVRKVRNPRTELDCVGAWILAYKTEQSTQMMRISERLGMVDPSLAEDEHPEIFDSLNEMLATADDGQASSPRRATKRARGAR